MRLFHVLVCLAGVGFASTSTAATRVVDWSGSGDHTAIQEAVYVSLEGDTIVVMPGTYTGTLNRNIDFGGTNIVIIGSAGFETSVVDCEGVGRGFLFHSGEDTTSVICGLSVVNGLATDGAGILCENGASPLVLDSRIAGCVASGNGGALCCADASSSPRVRGTIIEGNEAGGRGAGIYCPSQGSVFILGSQFLDNEADDRGGGVYCGESSNAAVATTYFSGNHASRGGGAYCDESSAPIITACTFEANSASLGGGVLAYNCQAALTDVSFLGNSSNTMGGGFYDLGGASVLVDVEFLENRSGPVGGASGRGGGMAVVLADPTLTNVTFEGNSAGEYGGGLWRERCETTFSNTVLTGNEAGYDGGGIYSRLGGDISGVVLLRNSAGRNGGGLYWESCTAECSMLTAIGNESGQYGGAVYFDGAYSSASLRRSTLVANRALGIWGAGVCALDSSLSIDNCIIAFSEHGSAMKAPGSGTPVVTHCYVYANVHGDTLDGDYHDNRYVDPLLCDFADDDATLCANSECLPAQNPWGESVGAWGLGCISCSSAAAPTSWGSIKARYWRWK